MELNGSSLIRLTLSSLHLLVLLSCHIHPEPELLFARVLRAC